MRESDRLGSLWVREGGRLKKRERERDRERRGSETDMSKLYPTMNMNSLCVGEVMGGCVIFGSYKVSWYVPCNQLYVSSLT